LIRTADVVPEVEQHFGDTAHADSTDPDEVKVLLSKKH
jgi:hypothetical protein